MTAAVSVRGVSRRFGPIPALDDVTLEIPRGSLCGLVGQNGAGKTTLLSILATLDPDFHGEATVSGTDVRTAPLDARRATGFVADETRGVPGQSVERYLHFFARAFGMDRAEAHRAVEGALFRVGLEPMRSTPSTGLSRGMTQRLALARALLHRPAVLLLDEPASGLDPRARVELKQILKGLVAEGHTVLISSHILTELGEMCDRLVVIDRGRVVVEAPVAELFERAHGGGARRRVTIELEHAAPAAADVVRVVPGVHDVIVDGALLALVVDDKRAIAGAVRALVAADVDVVRVSPERDNLEALFLSLTAAEVV